MKKLIALASILLVLIMLGCTSQNETAQETTANETVAENASVVNEENITVELPAANVTETIAPETETLQVDQTMEMYKQCVELVLSQSGDTYDSSEFELADGAEIVSMLSCISVGQELYSEEQYTGSVYHGTMIDAHNHFFYGSSVSSMIDKMDDAELDKILILSGDSMQLYEDYPDRIIPFYGSYEEDALDDVLANAEEKLKEGYKGIGEIDLRHAPVPTAASETKNPADSAEMKAVADIAAKYNVPVTVHHESNFDELERLLDYNPDAKIILAHAGTGGIDNIFRINRLLGEHPNLYVDLSQRTSVFMAEDQKDEIYNLLLSGGQINPIWKHVLEKYPDRFMVGGDYYVEDRDSLKIGADEFKKVLGQIDNDAAEKIAYQNVLNLVS